MQRYAVLWAVLIVTFVGGLFGSTLPLYFGIDIFHFFSIFYAAIGGTDYVFDSLYINIVCVLVVV